MPLAGSSASATICLWESVRWNTTLANYFSNIDHVLWRWLGRWCFGQEESWRICSLLRRKCKKWQSEKKLTVARSSIEAEYQSLANATSEALWVVKLLRELGALCSNSILAWCDSASAISLTANPMLHSTTKHVAVSYHFVPKRVTNGSLLVRHISRKEQQADLLTKPLPREAFCYLWSKLMVDVPLSLRGWYWTHHRQTNQLRSKLVSYCQDQLVSFTISYLFNWLLCWHL